MADAGPLIYLSWIDHLHILGQLFEEVIVPTAVRDEVLASPVGTLGLDNIKRALDQGWLRVQAPSGALRSVAESLDSLDAGELAAIALAEELAADLLLTDDRRARVEARTRGLPVAGTIGVLIAARSDGLIGAALPPVLELRRLGQWMSNSLVEAVRESDATRQQ